MPSTKKTPRRYDASRRQADALARQQRTAEAATVLFLEQGYGATSIGDIARSADVSTQFVYAAFESKAGVLARAVDFAIAGDTTDMTVAERAEARALMTEPDIDRRIDALVAMLRRSHERAASLVRVVESASATDPALAALADKLAIQLRKDLTGFVRALPGGAARSDMTKNHSGDVLYAICAPKTWTTLIERFHWTPDEYETWLVDTIHRLLLA